MSEGKLQLRSQLGVGRDGLSFSATLDDKPVVVHHLVHAAGDGSRLAQVAARLRAVSLAKGPGVLRVLRHDLEADIPEVVVEARELALSDRLASGNVSATEVLEICTMLAAVLDRAHRVGLAHGELCPSTVWVEDKFPWLDFTGLDTGALGAPSALDLACVPPERDPLTPAADGFALARLVASAYLGRAPDEDETLALPGPLPQALGGLLARDPMDRPPMSAVVFELARAASAVRTLGADEELDTDELTVAFVPKDRTEDLVGRFVLTEKLGEGAMGLVWRAEDRVEGGDVAIKLLSRDVVDQPDKRFRREARLLAQISHPNVARFIDAAPEGDTPWIAIELVRGRTLTEVVEDRGPLDEAEASSLITQAARGVAAGHEIGVVHRDLKPDNLMVVEAEQDRGTVKVVDFGIARRIDERESLAVTQGDLLLGTPLYMAPEQVRGDDLEPSADVYALAATLFYVLSGRTPFVGAGAAAVLAQVVAEPAPRLRELVPGVSEALEEVVARGLTKDPADRYPDAGAFADALDEAVRGPAHQAAAHPRLPGEAPRELQTFRFTWDLDASRAALWPFVSNTERINRAVGLSAIDYDRRVGDDGVEVYGELKVKGIALRWREHPYEWIEGQRLGYLREYSEGPWHYLRDTVELTDNEQGGTHLVHSVELLPRGMVGRAAAALEVGRNFKKGLDQVYRRIESLLAGTLGDGERVVDAFEAPVALSPDAEARLRGLEARLVERGARPEIVDALGAWLRRAPAHEAARLRPLALAARLSLPPREVVDACLLAADEGVLQLLWDLLCPSCRVPAQIEETLRAVSDHGHCDACDLDFDLDVAGSIEAIFRAHPQIRDAELATYCIGSPGHAPHVVAQMRVAAGERLALDLDLDDGEYKLSGRLLAREASFRVDERAKANRWDVWLSEGPSPELPRALGRAGQRIVLDNDTDGERVVRLERTAGRGDAMTAAQLAAAPLFRELFRGELLRQGQLLSVSHVSLLRVELTGVDNLWTSGGTSDDESRAWQSLQAATRALEDAIAAEGGAVVKLEGDGLLASFSDPVGAARGAFEVLTKLAALGESDGLGGRVAAHTGRALMLTFDNRLDYFGQVTRHLAKLAARTPDGRVCMSETLAADPGVARLIEQRAPHRALQTLDDDRVALLLRPAAS
jgi:serine/threonine protein kinase/class 3 adenylate cyclase